MTHVPADLQYTREHEWVQIEGDEATVGITDHAQRELGEIVFADLPALGRSFAAEEEIGTLESVKAVAQIYAPVDGEVIAMNQIVIDEPDLINDDPYGDGWLVRIRIAPGTVAALMSAEAYTTYVASAED